MVLKHPQSIFKYIILFDTIILSGRRATFLFFLFYYGYAKKVTLILVESQYYNLSVLERFLCVVLSNSDFEALQLYYHSDHIHASVISFMEQDRLIHSSRKKMELRQVGQAEEESSPANSSDGEERGARQPLTLSIQHDAEWAWREEVRKAEGETGSGGGDGGGGVCACVHTCVPMHTCTERAMQGIS